MLFNKLLLLNFFYYYYCSKILLISWIYIGDIERILLNYDYTLITYTITLTTQRTNCNLFKFIIYSIELYWPSGHPLLVL